jgi:hypothetical protein
MKNNVGPAEFSLFSVVIKFESTKSGQALKYHDKTVEIQKKKEKRQSKES